MFSSAKYVKPNRRVLVVDDNRAIHEDFIKTLGAESGSHDEIDALEKELFGGTRQSSRNAFEITSAYQGAEGLELVRAARKSGEPFALAFVDVRMPPGLDGIQTTAKMLEIDPEINIVICSAYSDHSWDELAEAIGETDRVLILKKPFDTIEIRQLAQALQRRWELARLVSFELEDLSSAVAERTRALEAANARLKKEAAARDAALRSLAESNAQIRELAYQDGLTGLPNRRLLNEHLEKILARSRRKATGFAVLFIDIDNFKRINDTLGHQQADIALRQLASELNELIRSEDVLASYADLDPRLESTISTAPITDSVLSRLGGDEFVIVLPDIKDRFAAGVVAHRIIERLAQPFDISGHELFFTVSIGVATFPEDGETAEALIRNADTAMYHAKESGKASFQYFSAEMNEASVERITIETGLRRAIEERRLELHYQPQIEVQSGRIIGAEALLRWNDPTRGYIPPATFIPIAEDCGLILPLGAWALERACREAMQWQRAGLGAIPVSVNFSGVQFKRQDVGELVKSVLADTHLPPSLLRVEITETSLMSASSRVTQTLQELRELGVRIELDDFGTGYSSLNQLRSLPLDRLKIDRSFVAAMLSDETTALITKAIIAMAQIIGLDVLAEGIETPEQLALIESLGCHKAQGFLFSKALPSAEFRALLAQGAIELPAGDHAASGTKGR
jgi:predicted signal transduction protein with EAL and GGDEF domain